MNVFYNFLRFLCCKRNKLQMNSYDDISSGEWYTEWEKEFDKSSSLREKHAKFYSSIPNIEIQDESQPEQCVS